MDNTAIGFIGGCINNQRGINRDDLYFSQVSNELKATGKKHQIVLGSYLSFNQLPEQIALFIEKKQPTEFYLFIRPFPLMPLHKPIVKYDKSEQSIGYALHPALFSRKLKWDNKFSNFLASGNFQASTKPAFGLRDLNLIVGIAFGLHIWALKYVTNNLQIVKQLCNDNNIRLVIISPPQNPESFVANFICKKTARYLQIYCKLSNINYININSFALDAFETDGIHFNLYGHHQLAKLIYDDIKAASNS